MDRDTFESMTRPSAPPEPIVTIADVSGPDRTLLYGYTCDRHSWHVYKQGSMIHLHVYYGTGAHAETEIHESGPSLKTNDLIPAKRVYPAATDAEFASFVLRQGVDIPWTTWNEEQWERVRGALEVGGFYGLVATDSDA